MAKRESELQDAIAAFEERQKRAGQRFPPAPRPVATGVWSPRMTDEQKRAHDQYVIDNELPF